jgi:hypothetical protein
MSTQQDKRWLTTGQIAALYEVTRDAVWDWITRGVRVPGGAVIRLAARRIGGRWKAERAAVETFIDACSGPSEPVPHESDIQARRRAKADVERVRRQMREKVR